MGKTFLSVGLARIKIIDIVLIFKTMTNKLCLIGLVILNLVFLPKLVLANGEYIVLVGNDEGNSIIGASEQNSITVRALNSRTLTTCFELESSAGGTFFSSSKVEIGSKIKSNIPKNENGVSNRNFYFSLNGVSETVFSLKTFLRPSEVTTSCDTWSPENNDWETYQKTVTVSLPNGDSDSEEETSTTSTTTVTAEVSNATNSSSGGTSSAHSSSVTLSSTASPIKFEVSAGREQISVVGNLVSFDAVVTRGGDFFNPSFTWSFGDGTSYVGKSVRHAYALPGTYEIVLNAVSGTEKAVSRTRVVVTKPEVEIEVIDFLSGYLILKNKSNREVNIGDWRIGDGSQDFVFPTDTLIVPGGHLPVAFGILGFTIGSTTQNIFLKDPQNKNLATTLNPLITTGQSDHLVSSLAEIESRLALISNQVNTLAPQQSSLAKKEKVIAVEDEPTKIVSSTSSNQVAGVGTISIVIDKPASWYDSFKNIPSLGFKMIHDIIGR